jgi:hypothetical protein
MKLVTLSRHSRTPNRRKGGRLNIAKIGGVLSFHTKLINALFIATIIEAGVISIFADKKLQLLMVELTTVMLLVKIIYMIHVQMRVNHCKFRILSVIEWLMAEIRQLQKTEWTEIAVFMGPVFPVNHACLGSGRDGQTHSELKMVRRRRFLIQPG